jgi:predicted ribosome quality control (RQC) complex YloA/Tae2 family protein
MIVETFLKKSVAVITKTDPIPSGPNSATPDILQSKYIDQPMTTALKYLFPQFGPVLVKELLTRAGLNGEQTVTVFLESELARLLDSANRMTKELLTSPSPRIYFDGATPVRFSIIPLNHLNEFTFQSFNSVSEAIQTYRANLHHEKTVLQEKKEIIRVLEREEEHTERTLHKIAEEAEKPSRADQYELFGKLLTAQIHLLKKGETKAVVEDFVSGSNELVEIPLDQHLTPAKNAERYFEKAHKSQRAAEEQHQRIAELTKRQRSISKLLDRMEDVSTAEDLKRFAEENRSALSSFGLKAERSGQVKKEEIPPFRVFMVAGGFQVWAGKSGENNDLLSTRHTAKNDLWFHARGVGGSHVVLKIGTGKGEVSKHAIEQAAGIAAYYSKMKKSKLVPVTMCEGKFVRKPKGVPAGTVTVEREKTIFAEPSLPPSKQLS